MTTDKQKIKELKKMVLSLSDDVTLKTEFIETQKKVIASQNAENSRMKYAVDAVKEELRSAKAEYSEELVFYKNREQSAKARLSIIQQVINDTINDRSY